MAGAGPFLHSVIAMNPECGCCPACKCCPDSNLEQSTFNMRNANPIGPGETGCPEYHLGSAPPFDPNELSLTVCDLPPELAELYPDVCDAFCTNGVHTFPGSFGNFSYEAILLCVAGSQTAFIKYNSGGTLLGLPDNEWIETAGGVTCPVCEEGDSGVVKSVDLWYDVFVNCGCCNSSDFNYETGNCEPLTLYSVRHYFTGAARCD